MNEPNVTTDTAEASAAPTPGSGIDYGLFLDCIHCGLCTSACPTYLETGNENDSPRGRIYLMRGVVDGRMAMSDRVRRHLDLCLDCRACETACPSGVQYGRLIEPFRIDLGRADAADHRKPGGWFERWVLYGLFPYPRRMAWALWPARVLQSLRLDRLLERTGLPRLLPAPLQRMQRLLPRLKSPGRHLPELLPAVGKRRARVGLFTGCVADALFRHTHWATARVLQANGCEVVVPRGQGCCGAIHYHSGAAEPAIDFFRENASAFPEDHSPPSPAGSAMFPSFSSSSGHGRRPSRYRTGRPTTTPATCCTPRASAMHHGSCWRWCPSSNWCRCSSPRSVAVRRGATT